MPTLKINPCYDDLTFEELLNCKKLTDDKIMKQYKNLIKYKCDTNKRAFVGNKILYHYQFEELLDTKRDVKNYKTIREIFNDPILKKKWVDYTIKINRRPKCDEITSNDVFECYRRCKGSVVFFKPITTKYLCKKFNATKVLDFTAGWGGRLLGARSLGLDYIGIDTNTNLKEGYDNMIEKFGGKMIYKSCLDVDFSKIDYDFVLTSPPYFNIELYNNMKPFESEKIFYEEFLIPMINKSLKYIKNDGSVCINISNYMYDLYVKYGGVECKSTIDLLQQMGGKKNKEMVYVFKN